MSESFKSVAQGVPEIFEEVYLGGWGAQCAPPPPLVGIGLKALGGSIYRSVEAGDHEVGERPKSAETKAEGMQDACALLHHNENKRWALTKNDYPVVSEPAAEKTDALKIAGFAAGWSANLARRSQRATFVEHLSRVFY